MKRTLVAVFVVSLMLFHGCNESLQQSTEMQQQSAAQSSSNSGSSSTAAPDEAADSDSDSIVYGDQFPEVLAVEVSLIRNENWRFNVTLSSSYDTPERYADAWRVLDSQDNQLGIRILGHDHANEQPFTRSATIKVPEHTGIVFVEGRDQANGWSSQRFEVKLPEADLPPPEPSGE